MTGGKVPVKTCCICDGSYEGYGNNADPVRDGSCCQVCDEKIVIPFRIMQIMCRLRVFGVGSTWFWQQRDYARVGPFESRNAAYDDVRARLGLV